MKRFSRKQLWTEGYKQGYKKALKEARMGYVRRGFNPTNLTQSNVKFDDAVETFAAAVDECAEEGETRLEGIIDYWQQVYGDDFLYGYESSPLDVSELADACMQGFQQAGFPVDVTPEELEDIFASYLEVRDRLGI